MQHSQLTGSGRISGHGFGGEVEIRIGAVQKGLAPLAVREGGLQDQSRAGTDLRVQWTSCRQSILHIETETEQGQRARDTDYNPSQRCDTT